MITNSRDNPAKEENRHRLNREIRVPEVRVTMPDGPRVNMNPSDALHTAYVLGVVLVDAAPTARPPVCKLIDYGKFKYQEQKRAQEAKAKQKVTQVKEVKFRPATDENDFQTKIRAVRRFLEGGDKAKITLRYRGREMAHQEFGVELMDRVKTELGDIAQVEQNPKLEGRQMIMVLGPKRKK